VGQWGIRITPPVRWLCVRVPSGVTALTEWRVMWKTSELPWDELAWSGPYVKGSYWIRRRASSSFNSPLMNSSSVTLSGRRERKKVYTRTWKYVSNSEMLWTRRSNNVDVFAVNRIDNEQQCPDLSCSLPQSSVPLPSPESYFPQLPSLTNHPPLYLTSWFHSLLVRASVLFRLAAHVAAVANTSWFCFPSLF